MTRAEFLQGLRTELEGVDRVELYGKRSECINIPLFRKISDIMIHTFQMK